MPTICSAPRGEVQIPPPKPSTERERQRELRSYRVLEGPLEPAYGDLTLLASEVCDAPMAALTLVDEDRQLFEARRGLDVEQIPRDSSLCAYAILEPDSVMVVDDAAVDARFSDNLFVRSQSIRFYAGAPLVTAAGRALGTLCVMDRRPRSLSERQEQALRVLARQVVDRFEMGRTIHELQEALADRDRYEEQLEFYQRTLEDRLAEVGEQSDTDPLTRLRNRRALMECLDEEIERSRRTGMPCALALIDVDHFKSFNDEFGHQAGDDALRQVAGLLESESRGLDVVARFGGEEFAVVLSNTDLDGGFVLAERFRKAISGATWRHRPVTVSIGVASSAEASSTDALIRAADEALYRSKAGGRNQTTCATAA